MEGATELLPFAAGKKQKERRKVTSLKLGKGVQEKRVSATQFHYYLTGRNGKGIDFSGRGFKLENGKVRCTLCKKI